MTARRPLVAALTALCGIAIGAGSLMDWVAARGPRPRSGIRHTSVAEAVHWSYQDSSPLLRSFGAVVLGAGLLVLIGALVGSRFVAGLFSLVAVIAAGLWYGLSASHYNPMGMPSSDLLAGFWLTAAGGVVGVVSAAYLRRSLRV